MSMRKPEQLLWDAMSNARPRDFWLQRVENGVGDGMPDVFVKINDGKNSNFWVELKAQKRPKRDTTMVFKDRGLRTSQKNWHRAYFLAGGRSFILAQLDFLGEKTLHLVDGKHGDNFNHWGFFELSTWALHPKTWPEIFEFWRTI